LSRWIRDYVFFPLNMRAGRRLWLRYFYLVLVMTLVGLWHGAGPGFVLWGTWHGLLMVAHRALQVWAAARNPKVLRALRWVGRSASLALITAGWVLFRAPTMAQSAAMLSSMFTLPSLTPAYGVNDYLLVTFCFIVYFILSPVEKRFVARDPESIDYGRWMFYLRPLAYAASLQLLFMFDRSNVGFIYFQF
jgi:D-alanyl-lipoteichoic acid acyltransferase DltB (MBOAT superfamily)